MPDPLLDRPPGAILLDREALIARFDGIRQFRQGGRRGTEPAPLLLLYVLARLKRDRQAEIRLNATGGPSCSPSCAFRPWGASARVSYPYSLVTDRLWQLPDPACDAGGNIREGVARQRDTPAGFAPDVLATFEREAELIDVVALHLLARHFAPGLHEEILEPVGLELGTPVATRRRAAGFRAAVLEAYHLLLRLPLLQLKTSAMMLAYQESASARVRARTSAVSPVSLTKPSTRAILSSVA